MVNPAPYCSGFAAPLPCFQKMVNSPQNPGFAKRMANSVPHHPGLIGRMANSAPNHHGFAAQLPSFADYNSHNAL